MNMTISQLINEILTEWAYRVDDGMPNPKNPTHLKELGVVLSEMGLSHIKNDLVENLLTEKGKTPEKHVVEAEKTFKNAVLNKTVRYKNTKGEDAEGIVGNLLRQPKGSPGRDAAERMLPPEGSEERDAINKDLGSENQPQKPEEPKDKEGGEDKGGGEEEKMKQAQAMFDPKVDPAMAARLDKEKETLAQLANKEKEKEQPKAEEPKKEDEFNPIAAVDVKDEIPQADPETFGGASDIPDGIDKDDLEKFNTDISKVKQIVDDAKAKGEKAPNINLCQITVPGTNLYCDDNLGIPREEMPQFKGKPQPGTPAADMPVDKNGEVDTEPLFKKMLKEKGITVTQTEVPADKLKATQSELVGAKVVGMMGALEENPEHPSITAPIYVSRDGFVIDGHHRWAAIAAFNAKNPDRQIPMKVQVVDMDIKDAIPMCNKFAEEQGVAAKKADANKETPTEQPSEPAKREPANDDPESKAQQFKGKSSGENIQTMEMEGGGFVYGTKHGNTAMVDDILDDVKSKIPKEKWGDIVFVGEGGATNDAGELEFNDEMDYAAPKFKEIGAEIDTWDGDDLDVHNDQSKLYQKQKEKTGLNDSQIKAGNWASMIGQGEGEGLDPNDPENRMQAKDYLDDEGKQFLQDAAKEAGLPPIEDFDNPTGEKPSEENGWKGTGDRGTLYRLAFPNDNGDKETKINDIQVAFNEIRDENLIEKSKELAAKGKIPITIAGESHVDLVDKMSRKGEEKPEETPTEKIPEPEEPSTEDGGVVYSLGGGYYSDTPGGPAQYRVVESVVEEILLEGDETNAYLLFEATVTKKTSRGKTVKLKTIDKSKQKAATKAAKGAAKKGKTTKKPKKSESPKLVPQQQIEDGLMKDDLSGLFRTNAILSKLRDMGIAGAGGAVASYGENLCVNTTNTFQKNGGFEGFVSKNKSAVKQKEKIIRDNLSKFQKQIDTIAKQLGFVLPEDEAEVIRYIAARMVFTDQEIKRLKADKTSLYYKKGKQGFGENDKAVEDWCKAAFDGAISTLMDLETDSLIDMSKPFLVMQSNPKEGGHDAPIISALENKLAEAIANGDKDAIIHYEEEINAFKKLGFHDTFAVGYTKEGRLTIKHISNKKQDDLQDIWGNTTPEYALNVIKGSFPPSVSKKVVEVIEDGILKVSDSKAATTKLFGKMNIDDDFVAICDTKQMKPYMDDLKGHPKFNAWLEEKGISPNNTKEWLKAAQQYVKETPNASYIKFGKLVHKVGELSQLGTFTRAYPKINFDSNSIKVCIKNKNDEKELVAAVHNEVADSIAKADKELGFPNKKGVNGPHTQAYLKVVMHSMHFDLMVENFDKRFSALTGIRASHPKDFRECLADLSGFKGNPKLSGKENRDLLNKHLLEKCRINPQTRAIEITDQSGTKVLAEDTWRTAGTSQKVEKKLGGSLRECVSKKVDGRQRQRRIKK